MALVSDNEIHDGALSDYFRLYEFFTNIEYQ
ncbi:MAG: hypothetical protein ACI9E1_001953 [Cryomorphaceae bacterium]|jgi:hypothetical protein